VHRLVVIKLCDGDMEMSKHVAVQIAQTDCCDIYILLIVLTVLLVVITKITYVSVSQIFSLAGPPFWLRKITTDPHILAHVYTGCPADWYPKLQTCISELTADSY
jgi:hypothetical protein